MDGICPRKELWSQLVGGCLVEAWFNCDITSALYKESKFTVLNSMINNVYLQNISQFVENDDNQRSSSIIDNLLIVKNE
jgi:hypothetical protein